MTKENALANYTGAMKNLSEHEEANAAVFKEHQRLAMLTIDADNALRDAVAEEKAGVSNDSFKVSYTPVEQTLYDEDIIRAKCPEAMTTQERPARITISKVA